jgi:hypothetical protein
MEVEGVGTTFHFCSRPSPPSQRPKTPSRKGNPVMSVITAASSVTYSWTVDVLVFAARRGVGPALNCLFEATLELFPSANAYHVLLLDDPAIRPNGHILFEVQLPRGTWDREEASRRWQLELERCCPVNLRHLLRLVVIAVET